MSFSWLTEYSKIVVRDITKDHKEWKELASDSGYSNLFSVLQANTGLIEQRSASARNAQKPARSW